MSKSLSKGNKEPSRTKPSNVPEVAKACTPAPANAASTCHRRACAATLSNTGVGGAWFRSSVVWHWLSNALR